MVQAKKFFQQSLTTQRGIVSLVPLLILVVLLVGIVIAVHQVGQQQQVQSHAQSVPSPCQFISSPGATPAFCDSFDQPMGIGNRSGDLNGNVWGASRATGNENYDSADADLWAKAQLTACGNTQTVQPENDIVICNGQLNEAVDDNGTVSSLAMYPKQPFDFAGRTGTIVFDVSDNSQGSHAAWPEFWMSDKPVPDPFTHESSWLSYPQNGFGLRFAGCSTGTCPGGSPQYVGVDSAVVVNNYVGNDTFSDGTTNNEYTHTLQIQGFDSMKEPTQPGQVNHIEIQVSQNQIDVYGTDAFSGPLNLSVTPLKHLATIPNANLTFTRGLIWLEDVHYNGNKFNTQRTNTFTWDNVGFDGPILPRDAAYDANDNLLPSTSTGQGGDPSIALGWFIPASSSQAVTVPNISQTSINNASGALLTYNFDAENSPVTLNFAVNGHQQSLAWPYPTNDNETTRTIGIPIPLSDIVPGNNTVTFSTDASSALTVMNIDLILVGGQGVPCSVNPSEPCSGSPLPTPSSTPVPTPTSSPQPSPSSGASSVPVSTPTPTPQPANGTLSILPANQTTTVGSTVTVQIHENSQTTGVNAVQANVTYPTNLLQLSSIDDTTTPSPFTLVAQESQAAGTITIAKGATTPQTGDQIVTTLHFTVVGSGSATIGLASPPQSSLVSSSTNSDILGSVLPASVTTSKQGDFNGDGHVNISDFSIFLSAWGQTDDAIATNLQNSGPIGIVDFSIFLSDWGT